MARSAGIDIVITGPPYSEIFSGTQSRVHKRGHLWLNKDSPNFLATFTILTTGFVFDDGGTGDARKAIYTGSKPDPNGFSHCGAAFGNPTLANGNTSLTISIANDDSQKYYYQLNFVDTKTKTKFSTVDPIIVNN